MYNLCRILQHIVDGFDDVSLAQHHPVIERYQLVFHVHTQSCHQLYAILKEKVKQLLRYVTFVCEQLAIQLFGESLEYLRVFVADICACKYKGYNLASVIACKMQFEAVTPAHRFFPIGGESLEYLIGVSIFSTNRYWFIIKTFYILPTYKSSGFLNPINPIFIDRNSFSIKIKAF